MTRASTLRTVALVAVLCCAGAGRVGAQGRTGTDAPDQIAFGEAMTALNGDDFATAERKFNDAIRLNNRLVDAYWRLAAIHYRAKQYDQAVALLRRCPDQGNLDVREQLALNLYKQKSPPPTEAVTLLEEVAQRRPEAFAVQLQLGQHFVRTDAKKAATALELYLKNRPSAAAELDPQIHMLLGTAYVYARDWDSAQREFDGLLRTRPNDTAAKLMLGTVLVGKGACSQAISLLERLHSEATKQPSIYYNLGSCYLKERRPSDALREGELYVKAKPQDAKAFLLIGDAQFDLRAYDKALTQFQQAERLDATVGGLKSRIGRTYLALKNLTQARTVLEQANFAQPDDVEVLSALVEVYVATGASKDRFIAIGERLSQQGQTPSVQLTAGQAFFAAGDDERAERAYRNVAQSDPSNLQGRGGLLRVLNRKAVNAAQRSDHGAAERLLREAVALSADDLMSNRNLAVTLIFSKRYDEAAQILERMLKKVPSDLVLNRLLGRALFAQRKFEAAIGALEKASTTAQRIRGSELVAVNVDLGAAYLEVDRLDPAIAALEAAAKEKAANPSLDRNLAIAYFRRGLQRAKDSKHDAALEDFGRATGQAKALGSKELAALACAEAFSALQLNRGPQAEQAVTRAIAAGGCAVKPPWDKFGLGFFGAYAAYRDPQPPSKREAAVKTFNTLATKAQGVSGEWLRTLIRSSYELLGYEAYQRSDERKSELYLKAAQRVLTKADRRELDHNLAVLDLFFGRLGEAARVFEGLGGKPPESLLNLGIVNDRQGDAKKALELFRRALERGARNPRLREWIDVKERILEAKS